MIRVTITKLGNEICHKILKEERNWLFTTLLIRIVENDEEKLIAHEMN